ncbi:MAG: COG1470 family protein [bacterium]
MQRSVPLDTARTPYKHRGSSPYNRCNFRAACRAIAKIGLLLCTPLLFAIQSHAGEYSPYARADLKVEVNSPQSVTQGSQLRFDVEIRNTGPDAAENLEVSIEIPDSTLFVLSTSPCDDAPGLLKCPLGVLKNGKKRSFSLLLQVPDKIAALELKTRVMSALPDPEPRNNLARSRIMVQADMPEQPPYLHYTPVVMNELFQATQGSGGSIGSDKPAG